MSELHFNTVESLGTDGIYAAVHALLPTWRVDLDDYTVVAWNNQDAGPDWIEGYIYREVGYGYWRIRRDLTYIAESEPYAPSDAARCVADFVAALKKEWPT